MDIKILPEGGTFIYCLYPFISLITFLTDVLGKVSFTKFDINLLPYHYQHYQRLTNLKILK